MIKNFIFFKLQNNNTLKFLIVAIFTILLSINCLFSAELMSIYDIQFTTEAGFDGTFPSRYVNQQVIIQGVVIGVGFEGNRYFVSEPQGGPWSAICVEDNRRVSVGDFVEVSGRVSEIMGMTVITNVQNFRRLLSNTPLPEPVNISINEALTSEAYESVLVRVNNVNCKRSLTGNFLAQIEDSTSNIFLGNGFNVKFEDVNFDSGEVYNSITGIINFSFNRFSIHPRSRNDINVSRTISHSSSWGKIKSLYR